MDKFVLQPELSSLALYALREDPPIGGVRMLRKLRAATFTMIGAQSITALAAPNRFLSSKEAFSRNVNDLIFWLSLARWNIDRSVQQGSGTI